MMLDEEEKQIRRLKGRVSFKNGTENDSIYSHMGFFLLLQSLHA